MFKHIAANLLTLMIVGLGVLGGIVAWGKSQFVVPGPLTQAICVRIEPGSSLRVVSQTLEEQEAISNVSIFRIGAQYTNLASQLRFGSYLLPEASSMEEILHLVTRGGASTCGTEVNFRIGISRVETVVRELDPATQRFVEVVSFGVDEEIPQIYQGFSDQPDMRYRITLAEGTTSYQVWDALNQAEFLSGTVAEAPAEGSLAPDSYEVHRGDDRGELLAYMQDSQTQILNELWAVRADGLPLASAEEALILASIVEKETGIAAERRQVASVFVNRLNQGIRLQTDPTVIYAVTNGQRILGRGLRQSELNSDSPYNTYRINGLPPTPIANPGRASIEATLNPDSTPFIFFVADGTGGHAFAVTLAEHNRNVAAWRAIEAARPN
jgi:UPF0755 protein